MSDALALLLRDAVEELVVGSIFCKAVSIKFVDVEEQKRTLGVNLSTCFRYAKKVTQRIRVAHIILPLVFNCILEAERFA